MIVERELGDHVLEEIVEERLVLSRQQRIAVERSSDTPPWRNFDELGEIPHAMALHVSAWIHAADGDESTRWTEKAEQQRDQRALARAVRSGEPEHFALAQLERKVVQSEDGTAGPRAIALRDVRECDHGSSCGAPDRASRAVSGPRDGHRYGRIGRRYCARLNRAQRPCPARPRTRG